MSKQYHMGCLCYHSLVIRSLSHLFRLRKWVLPMLSLIAVGHHTYWSNYYCLPKEVGVMRRASPRWFLIDNLAWGQVRNKHGGVDKPAFSPLLNPLLTISHSDICIKLQSERVELASLTLNLLIYDISCLLGVSVRRKEENVLILLKRRAKKMNFKPRKRFLEKWHGATMPGGITVPL